MGIKWSRFQIILNKKLLIKAGKQIFDDESGFDNDSFWVIFK